MALDVLSRFIHVATAIVLVGGSAFAYLVLLPAVNVLPEQERQSLSDAVKAVWKRIVHTGILLFLISGGYNFYRALPKHDGDSLYHALVGTKILLALVVFFIGSALVGRSAKFEFMRQNKKMWLGILLVLATVIVGISSFVKIRGPKSVPEPVAVSWASHAV